MWSRIRVTRFSLSLGEEPRGRGLDHDLIMEGGAERGGAPDRAASVRATRSGFKIRERSMLQDPPQLDGGVLRRGSDPALDLCRDLHCREAVGVH